MNPDNNNLFENMPAYGLRVDYETLPLNFQRYSFADQERIKAKMIAVKEAIKH